MQGSRAQLVGRFAPVSSVVVLGGRHEGVSVGRSTAGAGEAIVNFDPVSIPCDLSQGVSSFGSANQRDGLTQPDGFPLDVACDFRGSRRVCN